MKVEEEMHLPQKNRSSTISNGTSFRSSSLSSGRRWLSETTGATSSVKIPSTAEEAVTQNLYGNLFDTNKRTYEDVLKQPAVQKIYSDLEKMIDQAGIGNVKDTKATGTQAATGVMRDVAAGEAAGET